MNAALLANIGQRDLHLDGQPLPPAQMRETGRRIRDAFDSYQSRLEVPIIRRALDHIRSRGERLAALFLFATDQPEGEPHRAGDTIHAAHVIARLVQSQFQLPQPTILSVHRPHLYDSALREYRKLLRRGFSANPDLVYALCSGGTPQCNTALLLEATLRFRDRCAPLYVDEDGRVLPLDFARQILDLLRREVAGRFAHAWDFHAVAETHPDSACRLLACFAEHRLSLDFKAARRTLDELLQGCDERAHLLSFQRQLDALQDNDPAALLAEIYFQALLKLRRAEYTDFLGRVFRLIEAALRHCCEHHLQIPTEVKGRDVSDFRDALLSRPRLCEYLRSRARPGVSFDPASERPDATTLTEIVRYLVEVNQTEDGQPLLADDDHRRLADALAAIDRLEPLRQLRNRSLLGHGFHGVSRSDIEQAYRAPAPSAPDSPDALQALQEDLRLIASCAGPLPDDPFESIRNLLLPRP